VAAATGEITRAFRSMDSDAKDDARVPMPPLDPSVVRRALAHR
jgi:hypothetical protein